jgi:hypothetical protein
VGHPSGAATSGLIFSPLITVHWPLVTQADCGAPLFFFVRGCKACLRRPLRPKVDAFFQEFWLLASFCRETPRIAHWPGPEGVKASSRGRKPPDRILHSVKPRQERKPLCRNRFLSPPQGSMLHFDPTPGLRPGLFSAGPPGLKPASERVSRQMLASGALFCFDRVFRRTEDPPDVSVLRGGRKSRKPLRAQTSRPGVSG